MKYLPLLIFICLACSTGPNTVQIPNPFESEYKINDVKSDLSGTSTYKGLNSEINQISIQTNCEDAKTCPTVDIYVSHDFNENAVVLLYPDGKCAVPFSVDSGMLEVVRLEDGSFSGTFSVESREINGYQPDSKIGCSEDHYSSQGIRTLSFEGSFTALEKSGSGSAD